MTEWLGGEEGKMTFVAMERARKGHIRAFVCDSDDIARRRR